MSSVGETIKAVRKNAGLSQEELADLAGVSVSSMSKWERGAFTPTVSDFRRLLIICGYDMNIVELPGQTHDNKERK